MAGGLKLWLPSRLMARFATLGGLRVSHLAVSVPVATLAPSPGAPGFLPPARSRWEVILGPNTILGRAARMPFWVAMMGIPGGGAGPSSRQAAVGQAISERVKIMQEGGPLMREAAQVVLDFARNRSEAFTWDHVIAIITVSKDAAPTWFGNRAVAALAANRLDLFTGPAVALLQSYNDDPNTKGCFQLALQVLDQYVLDQNVPPPPAASLPPPPPTPAPQVASANTFVWSTICWWKVAPPAPDLKMPPKPTP